MVGDLLGDVVAGVLNDKIVWTWCLIRCLRELLPQLQNDPLAREALDLALQPIVSREDRERLEGYVIQVRDAWDSARKAGDKVKESAYMAAFFGLNDVAWQSTAGRPATRLAVLALAESGAGTAEDIERRLVDELLKTDCSTINPDRPHGTTVARLIFQLARERQANLDAFRSLLRDFAHYLVDKDGGE